MVMFNVIFVSWFQFSQHHDPAPGEVDISIDVDGGMEEPMVVITPPVKESESLEPRPG